MQVTRRAGEEWDPTYIMEKYQRKKGWMFWGCFHGAIKGPGIFWEKDQGSILVETYQSYIVPIIYSYIKLQRRAGIKLVLMRDGVPGHAAADTRKDLLERGVIVIYWPPFSPNLTPIEKVQHIIKNYLQDYYPENISYDQLRAVVKDAQEKVRSFEFEALINTMRERC